MESIYETLTIGANAPSVVCAVIEVPKGSHNKYEYDEKRGVFALDRVLYSPVHYPLDYGFIPETRSEDGDHLDIMVIGSDPVFVGCVLDARPIGLLKMIDGGDEDFKILAVQTANPRFSHITDIADMQSYNPHLLKEISHFFKVYKDLQGKKVDVLDWHGASVAHEEIERALKLYKQ
ncbi:MAG: hypothetical protein RIQ54_542 [Candidatus Parcubacteria bacterium]|jgi:inorganic pyrophosphatase